MRTLRILVDIAPLQLLDAADPLSHYVSRGLRALSAENPRDLQLVLLANGHLGDPPELSLGDGVPWRLVYSDYPLHRYSPSEWMRHSADYQAHYEALLARIRPDVVHRCAPLETRLPLLAKPLSIPTVVTVDDLCPWALPEVFGEHAPAWQRSAVQHAGALLASAQRLLAPNNEIARLLRETLDVSPERIMLAPPLPAQSRDAESLAAIAQAAQTRLGIGTRYILCNTTSDLRGNLRGALQAYAGLPPSLRRRHPLLLTCAMDADESWFYYAQAADLDIADDLIIATPCSRAERDALLLGADLLLNPRRYDPLGLDLLDAAAWGVPVITTSAAPAVARDASMTIVDPADIPAMTEALREALQEEGEHTPVRSPALPVADALSAAYREITHRVDAAPTIMAGAPAMPELRRLALVTPLPPERTGIADFSADLARALARRLPVTAYVDPALVASIAPLPEIEIRSADRLGEDLASDYVDLALYQVGNSRYHLYMLPLIERYPGIVELHDGILHNLCAEAYLPHGDGEGYLDALSFAHGPVGREWAQDVLSGITPETRQQPTVNRRVTNWSLGVITHNPWAARAVAAQGNGQPIWVSPIPIAREEGRAAFDRIAARETLGLPQDALVLATFGRLTPTKRLAPLLRAFARLRETTPEAWLCLVGALEENSSAAEIPALAQELGVADRVIISGYVERPTFLAYLAATDIGVNLRFPHAGETSATLTLLLNAGLPVITSNVGPFLDLPDDCCWKVDADESEVDLLLAYLQRLARDRDLRSAMGRNALGYVQRTLPTWDQAAERYLRFVREVCGPSAQRVTG